AAPRRALPRREREPEWTERATQTSSAGSRHTRPELPTARTPPKFRAVGKIFQPEKELTCRINSAWRAARTAGRHPHGTAECPNGARSRPHRPPTFVSAARGPLV